MPRASSNPKRASARLAEVLPNLDADGPAQDAKTTVGTPRSAAARAAVATLRQVRMQEANAARARERAAAKREHKQKTSIYPLERLFHGVIRQAVRDAKVNRPYAQVVLPHQQLFIDRLIDQQEYDNAEWWLTSYSIAHGQPQRAGMLRVDNVDGDGHEREGRRQVALDNLLAVRNALGTADSQRLERVLGLEMSWRSLGGAEHCSQNTAKDRTVETIKRLDKWRTSRRRKPRSGTTSPVK